MWTQLSDALLAVVSLGVDENCDEDERTTRRAFTSASLFVTVVAPVWGVIYIAYDEPYSGWIPTGYSIVTAVCFVALWRLGGWQWFRISQLVLIFTLPIALMLSLGGFIPGSAVILWSMLAPLGALWSGRVGEGLAWSAAFLAGTILAGALTPLLPDSNNLPDAVVTIFFVLNLTFVPGVTFWLLGFYVRQKDTLIGVMRRNRELESAFLQQEVSLRQNEKLATLGRLSAGMAHELNNPTAAAKQATEELSDILLDESRTERELATLELDDSETEAYSRELARVREQAMRPEFLDPLTRSDLEQAVEDQLEGAGLDDAWRLAPVLVDIGVTPSDLEELETSVRPPQFEPLIETIATQSRYQRLIESLGESTGRISEILAALKSYSRVDEAPRHLVDVREGLDSTLVMLQSMLRGIEVHRHYADEVPEIEAYGSELNQVWTNVLDNAVDALDGNGTIDLTVGVSEGQVLITIADDGPGVPDEVLSHVFDPFVTTKPPGRGTGLGLNIAHNIVTQKHGGSIEIASGSDGTVVTVSLPTYAAVGLGAAADEVLAEEHSGG